MSCNSVSLDRTRLLSSKQSTLRRRSCAPVSVEPSPHACRFVSISRNGLYGSCKLPPVAAEMNTSFKRRLQLWFKPRVATGFRRRTTRPAVISYSELIWGDDCQAHIAPELTLRPKTMRRVHRRHNESTAYGSPFAESFSTDSRLDVFGFRPTSPASPLAAAA